MASRVIIPLAVVLAALAFVQGNVNSDDSSSEESAEAPPRTEQSDEYPTIRVYCQRKYPVSDEVIDNMLTNVHIPKDRNATCWYGCAMRRIDVLKNHEINWNKAANIMKIKWNTPEFKKIVDKVIDICKKEISYANFTDYCDLAYDYAKCQKIYGDKYGLPHVSY